MYPGVNLVWNFCWQAEGLLGLCKRLLDAGALIYNAPLNIRHRTVLCVPQSPNTVQVIAATETLLLHDKLQLLERCISYYTSFVFCMYYSLHHTHCKLWSCTIFVACCFKLQLLALQWLQIYIYTKSCKGNICPLHDFVFIQAHALNKLLSIFEASLDWILYQINFCRFWWQCSRWGCPATYQQKPMKLD